VSSAQTAALTKSIGPTSWGATKIGKIGFLDCNGQSTIQKSVKPPLACTDIRGLEGVTNANNWGGRFYDNGVYIGHDEPDVRFISSTAGSGGSATWTETLGVDPSAAPTVKTPGSDVTHYVELTVAPWFSMAVCDPNSYPQLPCTPNSDANAASGPYPGAGSAFVELQLYPPGMAPWVDSISCNNTSWCAALTIDSLECTYNFVACNPGCEEPVNFGWIQRNGVPTGPPNPQMADLKTSTPNAETLMMKGGDKVRLSLSDAPVPGVANQKALLAKVVDVTTGQSGYMQASAKNGFADTNMLSCQGTPFNFEPEYSTAAAGNQIPWAALQTNISTEFEIGHFEPCTTLGNPGPYQSGTFFDVFWNKCGGPYEKETAKEGPETGDAFCYPAGDTHFGTTAPNIVTGCEDNWYQNGDLDFDGTSYWPDWPNSNTPDSFPSSFLQSPPRTVGNTTYTSFQIQTDVALSEVTTCKYVPKSGSWTGCTAPPPNAPGKFYPYWTLQGSGSSCQWEFGNMTNGNDFGKAAQYGSVPPSASYPELLGPIQKNPCT